jgi:hypothetical protein
MGPLPLPENIGVILHCLLYTMCTLKLLLPLPISDTPHFLLFDLLLLRRKLLSSLVYPLLVLCIPLLKILHPFFIFLRDLCVHPLLKITERWRSLQSIQRLVALLRMKTDKCLTNYSHH